MKTLIQLKNKLTVTLLALACVFTAQAAKAAVHDMDSQDYLRVTIPEENLADARLVYAIDGQKIEAFPSDGEVVTFHAEKDDFLGKLFFSAVEESEGSFLFTMTGTQPLGYDYFIHFKSTNEGTQIDGEAGIYLNATGAAVEVVSVGGQDEIIQQPATPLMIGEESQDFSKLGLLEMRIVVKAAEAPDGDGDANDGQNNDGGNNGDLDGGQAASGGCSMVAGVDGASALNLAGFAAVSTLSLALRRRAKRK